MPESESLIERAKFFEQRAGRKEATVESGQALPLISMTAGHVANVSPRANFELKQPPTQGFFMKTLNVLIAAAALSFLGACASTDCGPCSSKQFRTGDKSDSYKTCSDMCKDGDCHGHCPAAKK
jgi:hypothetical protein